MNTQKDTLQDTLQEKHSLFIKNFTQWHGITEEEFIKYFLIKEECVDIALQDLSQAQRDELFIPKAFVKIWPSRLDTNSYWYVKKGISCTLPVYKYLY